MGSPAGWTAGQPDGHNRQHHAHPRQPLFFSHLTPPLCLYSLCHMMCWHACVAVAVLACVQPVRQVPNLPKLVCVCVCVCVLVCLYVCVCSQFTSFLDLVEPALAAEGFATARLDGRTPAKRRGDILRAFQSGAVQPAAAAPPPPLPSLLEGASLLDCRASLLPASPNMAPP